MDNPQNEQNSSSSSHIDERGNKVGGISVVVVAALVLLAVAAGGYYFFLPTHSYLVGGIPYTGVYTYQGDRAFVVSSTDAALGMVFEYWNPDSVDYDALAEEVTALDTDEDGSYNVEELASYADAQSSYSASVELLSLRDLKRYVNDEVQTPIVTYLPVVEPRQEVTVPSFASVLIGVDEGEQKLIFHHFLFGNNYEMTFDEYEMLLELENGRTEIGYLIIQPTDVAGAISEKAGRADEAYPSRTALMEAAKDLFANYAVGAWASAAGEAEASTMYFSQLKNDPRYEELFPPYFKVYTEVLEAENQMALGNFDHAIEHISRAIDLNHDLNQPLGEWQGVEHPFNNPEFIDRMSVPYRVLGNLYVETGLLEDAREAYQRALEISPGNSFAFQALQSIEVEIGTEQ